MEKDHIKQLEDLSKKIKEGVVVLHGGKTQYRNADTWYPFRQNSYFHYLTSWPEPDAHAIIRIKKGKPELFLFVLEKNEEMETWDGKRIGVEGAEKEYGATKAYPNTEYQKRFEDLVKGHSNIYLDYSSKDFEELDKKLIEKSLPNNLFTSFIFPRLRYSLILVELIDISSTSCFEIDSKSILNLFLFLSRYVVFPSLLYPK